MASGTWTVYGPAITAALSGNLDLSGNSNLFMMFTSSTHTPSSDHEFEDDLTNIVSGTGLSSAGVAITGTMTYTSATDTNTFDVSDVNESNVTATGIRNCHIVDKTGGSPATNRLIAFTTLDSDLSPNDGTLSITIDAGGVFDIAPAS